MNLPTKEEIRSFYRGIEHIGGLGVDAQGWNSTTPIFDEVIGITRPDVLIEVGTWKGASVIHMANLCKGRGIQPVIYAVDAFRGFVGDEIDPLPSSQLPDHWNRIPLYWQFLRNMKANGHDDCVIPVPAFSVHGAKMLTKWGVKAKAIYIDGNHSEEGAYADTNAYWPLLEPGGIMFWDDFTDWGVLSAVGRFAKEQKLNIRVVGGQALIEKPL